MDIGNRENWIIHNGNNNNYNCYEIIKFEIIGYLHPV